jgi:hypothetical protein
VGRLPIWRCDMPPNRSIDQSDLLRSPLFLIAVLIAARRGGDRPLEQAVRQQLAAAGVRIIFGDEVTRPQNAPKGGRGHA